MVHVKYTAITAAMIAASTGIAHGDGSSEAQVKDLLREVESLRAEVADLRARDEGWINEERESAIRGLVSDVLADADSRTSLLQSGATAGYDDGFFVASSDGNFKLQIGGYIQFRYIYNKAEQQPDQSGFENSRTYLIFQGHVVDPSWTYKVSGNFSTSGTFGLKDAYVNKSLDNGWSIKAGQFKGPLLREELVGDEWQLAVDRSIVHNKFTQGRSQGVQVEYAADTWRIRGMFHDGLNTANTPWTPKTTEWAFAGRAEAIFMGDWSQFKGFSSPRGSENALLVGVAANYQSQPYGTAAGPENKQLRLTVDADYKFDGGNVFAAFVYDDNSEGTSNPWGIVVQGGYFLTDDWEAFVRYEYGDEDVSGAEKLSVITFGANRYFAGNTLKWTTDVGIGLNEITPYWGAGATNIGYRADVAGESTQVVIRSQIQVQF